MSVSINGESPKWMFIMENAMNMDDLGVPPISGNARLGLGVYFISRGHIWPPWDMCSVDVPSKD